MLSELTSVTGPVRPDELGVTMPHEHTFLDVMREYRGDGLIHDAAIVTADLRDYAAQGGRTIVDCTTRGLRPEPSRVRQVSQDSGVAIILGTGFYRHPYLDEEWFDRHSTDEVADLLVRDIREGIDGTGVRAGVIGEIGCDRFLTPAEERSFRAAARAHLETGLTITTHAARWPVGLPQLRLLESEGVPAGRVIIGHSDMVPDFGYHLAIAERGAWVQFDTIQAGPERQLAWTAEAVRRLVTAGFGHRVLLSQDICLVSQFRTMGGSGYGYVVREFLPRLRAAGVPSALLREMVTEHPVRALSGADA